MAGKKQKGMVTAQRITAAQKFHSGPLPEPADLVHYNEAVPNAAERILKMAENQALHRQTIEKKVIDTQNRNSLAGIIASSVISLVIVFSGVYCILQGHDWAGGTLVTINIAAICGVYIYGTKAKDAQE